MSTITIVYLKIKSIETTQTLEKIHKIINFILQFSRFFAIIILMKFELNQKVVHCRNGVSTIVNTAVMSGREYLLIRSLRGDGENIYVPMDAPNSIIRPVMKEAEADLLLSKLKDIELEFNPNTKQRRDSYKKRLSSGNVEDIAYLFRQKNLYEEFPDKVKLGPNDIDMLRYAAEIFLDELSLTYNLDRSQIEELVKRKIES